MAETQPVNFRANTIYYQQTKQKLEDSKVTVSDILNAVLRKVAIGEIDATQFVTSESSEADYSEAFASLRKEVLKGHLDIQEGRVYSLAEVKEEFGID